ncbi:MAG: GAF domain-containing protein [Abditibacteriota bacterium]|nr:GAF domain-containing protein [Abditibacteriota bacterium]
MPIRKYIPFGLQENTEHLLDIGRTIVEVDDIDVVLQTILEECVRVCNGTRGFLAIIDHDRGSMNVKYVTGPGWADDTKCALINVSEETGKGITGRVAATAESYMCNDTSKDPYYVELFDDVRSEMAVPLSDDVRTRGVLSIASTSENAFKSAHEYVVRNLCDMATTAMTLADYRRRERAIVRIGGELTGITERTEIIEKVLQITAEVLQFEDCSVFLADKDKKKLSLVASQGTMRDFVGRAEYEFGHGLTGCVAKDKKPLRLRYPHLDPRWSGWHGGMEPERISAFLAVPIFDRTGVAGVIRLQREQSKYPWFSNSYTAEDEKILTAVADRLGTALDNSALLDKLIESERMAAWGELSARSAHMIGNRVFAIKGDINEIEYVLGEENPDKEELNEILAGAKRGIFLLEEILNEFRMFVKADKVDKTRLDIGALLKETLGEFFGKRSGVKTSAEVPEEPVMISGDATKLKRVISELLENATNFLPADGEIKVTLTDGLGRDTARKPKKKVRAADYVRIRIADNGCGVREEDKENIFNPFFTSRAKGMGLGLPIVKGVIEAHDGVVYEDGKEGEGAVFNILLPK